MSRLFLFFSHQLTDEQKKDIEKLKIEEIILLPEKLQKRFSNVPPELDSLDDYVKPFLKFLFNNSQEGDYILLQGDFGLVYKLVEFSKVVGLIPIYATTKRVAIEKLVDGKNIKVSEFKHIRFRKY